MRFKSVRPDGDIPEFHPSHADDLSRRIIAKRDTCVHRKDRRMSESRREAGNDEKRDDNGDGGGDDDDNGRKSALINDNGASDVVGKLVSARISTRYNGPFDRSAVKEHRADSRALGKRS